MPIFIVDRRRDEIVEMDICFNSPKVAGSCFEQLKGARFKDKTVVCIQWSSPKYVNIKKSQWIHLKDLQPNTTREQIANLIQREAAVFINEKNIYIQRCDELPDALITAFVECSKVNEAQMVIRKVKMQLLKGHKVWCQEWNGWNKNCAYLELSNLHSTMNRRRLLAHLQEVTGIKMWDLEKLSMNWEPQTGIKMYDRERSRKVIVGFRDKENVRFTASAINGTKFDGREVSVKWSKFSSYLGGPVRLQRPTMAKNG